MDLTDSSDLRAENERLAARIAELETQLVHAPVDRRSLYRMTDHAPWGAFVVNRQGRVDYANPAFQKWLTAPTPATDEIAEAILHGPLLEVLRTPMAHALDGRQTILEAEIADRNASLRHIRVQVAPREAGNLGVTGLVVSLYDITETQAALKAVREKERWLDRINTVVPSANHIFDFAAGKALWVSGAADAAYDLTAEELVALSPAEIRDLIHVEDRHKIEDHLKQLAPQPDGTVAEFEIRARRRDGTYRWLLIRAVAFERDAAGRVTKALSSAIDIDERKRAEARQALLINELNHRVKNTLAAVQSIARQTLRSDRDPKEMTEIFTARLVSLSAAHNVLTRENWEGAGLHEIVGVAMAPFDETRITVKGPDVRLAARGALAMAMALHELATNATKYGALSNETGKVSLTWRSRRNQGQATLELDWRESGGPAVTKPSRQGFGSRLLSQGVRGDLDGVAELSFEPSGVICRIRAPLDAAPPMHLS